MKRLAWRTRRSSWIKCERLKSRRQMSEVRHQKNTPIRHFTDLIVWQRAHGAALEIFRISKSCRSVGANLAEAWGKRRYEAAFVAKLVDADAEAHEPEHWLINAEAHGYIAASQLAGLRSQLSEVGRMLGSMIGNPTPFLAKRLTSDL